MAQKRNSSKWKNHFKTGYTYKVILLFVLFSGVCLKSYGAISLPSTPKVYTLSINSTINPYVSYKIENSIEYVKNHNGQALILLIDTPGGLLVSMQKIVESILNSPVPVIAYVYPPGAMCASAGTFIALSCNYIAMAPGTNIGAAHPVSLGTPMGKTEKTKILNAMVSYIKAIAKERGKNVVWAENAVRKSIASSDETALKEHVIDFIAPNMNSLLHDLNGKKILLASGKTVVLDTKNAEVEQIPYTFGEKLLEVVGNPNVASILLIIGIIGIVLEFLHPGLALPGIVGTISLVLSFYAFQAFNQSFTGVFFIIIGAIMFIIEVFAPSHGLFAIAGTICLMLGSWMLFHSPSSEFHISLFALIRLWVFLFLCLAGIFVFIRRTKKRKVTTGKEGMPGETGHVLTELNPEGTVRVHGEEWNAYADTPISKGTEIKIVKVEDMKLKVVPIEKENK
ncbi:MAG: nodulation protein NfeD [Candidatus Omnitrophica bacterium]|nr:nodulation protein NfeD [Candidatus Omnitrophota bacterium]